MKKQEKRRENLSKIYEKILEEGLKIDGWQAGASERARSFARVCSVQTRVSRSFVRSSVVVRQKEGKETEL